MFEAILMGIWKATIGIGVAITRSLRGKDIAQYDDFWDYVGALLVIAAFVGLVSLCGALS